MSRQKHDRQWIVGGEQPLLQIETTRPGQIEIENIGRVGPRMRDLCAGRGGPVAAVVIAALRSRRNLRRSAAQNRSLLLGHGLDADLVFREKVIVARTLRRGLSELFEF